MDGAHGPAAVGCSSATAASIEAFPDELLLHILSFVADGVTLLDAVPLVCKRWRRLARDPQAWEAVRVRVEDRHGNDTKAVAVQRVYQDARIILRAPALRSVDLTTFQARFVSRNVLFSALRRSQAIVGELHLNYIEDKRELAVQLGLLWRCRDHIRAVSMGWLPHQLYSYGISSAGDQLTILGVLGGLQRLEELRTTVHPGLTSGSPRSRFFRYLFPTRASPPSLHLPRLRLLDFTVLDDVVDGGGGTLSALLIRSCAGSLRHLQVRLPLSGPKAEAVVESLRLPLARCVSFMTLRIDVQVVAAVTDCHQLHSLRLDMGHFTENTTAALRRAGGPLRSLRSLNLVFNSCYGDEEEGQLLVDLLAAVARLAANATSLSVVPNRSDKVVLTRALPALLDGMPGLQGVSLGQARARLAVDALPRLRGLERLRQVSGRLRASNEEELAYCEAAIATFKQRRPEVQTDDLVCSV